MSWDDFETEAITKIDALASSMARRLIEIEAVRDAGRQSGVVASAARADLAVIARGDTALSGSQRHFGEAHLQTVKLTHDLEIAVSEQFVGTLFDLNRVFPPIDFPLNPHNMVHAAQAGAGTVALQSAPPDKVLPSGQLAIDLPINISVLGQTASPGVFIPFQLARPQQPTWTRKFAIMPGRGPQICPASVLKTMFSGGTIEYRVREEALAASQGMRPFDVDASFFDDLFGPSYFYAGLVTSNIAFFGVARDRARTTLAPLGPLPGWATAGLKMHQSLLSVLVMAEAPKGARLTRFDADTGAQVFRFALAMEQERSWGNDLVRVRVAVRVTGNFHLAFNAVQPSQLDIASVQEGALQIDRTKVDTEVFNTKIDPPGVDHVIERLAREIAERLAGDLGNYSTSLNQYVPNCSQLSCTVLPEALVLHVSI